MPKPDETPAPDSTPEQPDVPPAPDASTDPPKPDPTRIVIEQPAPEPAVLYGEGGIVPGSSDATNPDRPHVQAEYQGFTW